MMRHRHGTPRGRHEQPRSTDPSAAAAAGATELDAPPSLPLRSFFARPTNTPSVRESDETPVPATMESRTEESKCSAGPAQAHAAQQPLPPQQHQQAGPGVAAGQKAAKRAARKKKQAAHKRLMRERRVARLLAMDAAAAPDAAPPAAAAVLLGAAEVHIVASRTDARLRAYSNLKRHDSVDREGLFIAEGPEPIRLLLANRWAIRTESLLLKPSVFTALEADIRRHRHSHHPGAQRKGHGDVVPPPLPPLQCYVMPANEIAALVGFGECRGALACGVIPGFDADTAAGGGSGSGDGGGGGGGSIGLPAAAAAAAGAATAAAAAPVAGSSAAATAQGAMAPRVGVPGLLRQPPPPQPALPRLLARALGGSAGGSRRRKWRLLAIDASNNASNIGSMVRSASAFGVHAVLLSGDCCDQWSRQCVRVSMGHIFNVPVVRCGHPRGGAAHNNDDGGSNPSLADTLVELAAAHGVECFAAVIDDDAPRLDKLRRVADRWCCVMGNEHSGVSAAVRAVPGMRRLRIAMKPKVDSLSINNAAAICMHGLREREGDDAWD